MYVTVPTHDTQLEMDVASCPLTPEASKREGRYEMKKKKINKKNLKKNKRG